MTRAALLAGLALALAAALAAPAASQHGAGEMAGEPHVTPASIGFDAVRPARLDIVTGESVLWTNVSIRVHTVTADDDAFDSGRLGTDETFSHRFLVPGTVPYHCTIHPFIRGVVGVHDLLLAIPGQPAAPGRRFPLSGRAALPAGTAVTIEADGGAGFAPVGTTRLQPDGTFSALIVPTTSAAYRAVAAGAVSPPVQLLVLDRRISLSAQRGRHRVLLRTQVAPASPGGRVVLQLFLPEHFGWWPVERVRLGGRSRARFALRPRRRVAARAVLTLADGATQLAVSRTVHVGPVR